MVRKYFKMAELRAMSNEELIKISCERNSQNKLTVNAENAMKVRKERSGSADWEGISNHAPSFVKQQLDYEGYGNKKNKRTLK